MLEDLQSDQDRSEEQRHKLTEQIKALIGQCEKTPRSYLNQKRFCLIFAPNWLNWSKRHRRPSSSGSKAPML